MIQWRDRKQSEKQWRSPDRSDVQETLLSGFDFLVAPLVHSRYRRPALSSLPKGTLAAPFTRSDLILTSSQWSNQVPSTSLITLQYSLSHLKVACPGIPLPTHRRGTESVAFCKVAVLNQVYKEV